MLRKLYLVPAILSLACLLTLADFAQAQRRGGGGGNRGGNWNNSGNRGGNWNNNGYRGGYYNNYRDGYHNDGWWGGVGVYINPSLGYRYGYPYRSYDSYYYTPPYYSTPATDYVTPVTYADDSAHIRVIVPDPAARVWFNGALTSQTGSDRLFNTPNLTTSGTYQIRAAWMQGPNEVNAERTVTVSPGQSVMVDFTRR